MEEDHVPLSEEQRAAQRSNRRALLVILAFILGLGVIPLVVVLLRNAA